MDVLTVSDLRGSFHSGNLNLNQISFLREVRLYGMFRDIEVFARTYYTLESLGVLPDLHLQIFRAIHNNGRRLDTIEKMTKFVSEYGVDPEKFLRTYNDSFGVKAKYQRALARQKIYAARGVPALIVNGKYRIEGSMVSNSNLGMLQVVDFLIAKEKNLQPIRE